MPTCTAKWAKTPKHPAGRCERETAPGAGGSGDLCTGHYQQQRRALVLGESFRPLRERMEAGEGEQVHAWISAEERAQVAAARGDEAEGAWIRDAIRMRLKGKR